MSYKALYRVFRPKSFSEVVGQESIVTILKNQIKSNQISHAYLFTGTRGTGKTSVAKIFARAISCPDTKDGEPCGKCQLCEDSLQDNSVDIIEIDAASNNGVDEIRDLRDKVKFAPVHGKYKVYIIDEVHMLSSGAFNALLKTLEEPPAHAVFILATTEPHKLPDTIISRCQRYDFNRIPTGVMVEQLKKIATSMDAKTDDAALTLLASHSEGGLRDAIGLLDQCIVFGENNVTEDVVRGLLGISNESEMFALADAILHFDGSSAITQIEEMTKKGKDTSILAGDIIAHFRGLLVYQMCKNPSEILSAYYEEDYKKQSGEFSLPRILDVIEKMSSCQLQMRYASIPIVFLELAIMQLCNPTAHSSGDSLDDRINKLEDALKNAVSGSSPAPKAQESKVTPIQEVPVSGKQETPPAQDAPPWEEPRMDGDGIEIPPVDPLYPPDPIREPTQDPVKPPAPREKESESVASPGGELNKQAYDALLKHVRKENKSLYTMMNQGFFDGAENGKLTIGFPGEECEVFMQAVDKRKDEIAGYLAEIGFPGTKICVTMSSVDSTQAAIDLFGKENIKIIE